MHSPVRGLHLPWPEHVENILQPARHSSVLASCEHGKQLVPSQSSNIRRPAGLGADELSESENRLVVIFRPVTAPAATNGRQKSTTPRILREISMCDMDRVRALSFLAGLGVRVRRLLVY